MSMHSTTGAGTAPETPEAGAPPPGDARLCAVFDYAPVGMAIVGLDGAWQLVNPSLCRMLGYAQEELIGTPFQDITHPDDRAAAVAYAGQLLDSETPTYHVEKRYLHRDGHTIWVLVTVVLVRDAAGEPQYYIGQVQDISAQKHAERALRESELRFRTLVEQLPATVYTARLDDHNSTSYVSPHVQHLLGIAPAELLADPQLWERQIHPDDQALVRGAVSEGLSTGAGYALEYRLCTRDGRVVWVRDVAHVRCDAQGQPLLQQGVALDITELKEAEALLREERAQLAKRVETATAELRVANAELARASRMKDEFLASMSHELRTPLNSVLGLAESLREQTYGALNERQDRAVSTIAESGSHLLNLINDILDLAKIGAGKLTLDCERVAVADLCETSLRLVRPSAQRKRLALHATLDPLATHVQGDGRRLVQILLNLLSNAVKFTPDGGSVGLEVASDRAAQELRLTVWDTGIGIALEQQPLLFQPFVQLDSRLARHHAGTGLGLVLVQRLAELHGGRVSVESAVGVGSRFTVTLPWRPGQAAPASAPAAAEVAPAPPPPAARKLILLADDNKENSELVVEYLGRLGYRVACAATGTRAVALALELRPALILMDVQMPELDGLEATRRLCATPELRETPILMLTALAMEGDRQRCLDAGASDYLSKPVRLRTLGATIAAHLAPEGGADPAGTP